MPCQRDEFVRGLLLANFDYVEDMKSAQLFRRSGDGAEVLVPKRASVDDSIAVVRPEPVRQLSGGSPCCQSSSKLRGVFSGVTIMRCDACHVLWQRDIARPALRLVP